MSAEFRHRLSSAPDGKYDAVVTCLIDRVLPDEKNEIREYSLGIVDTVEDAVALLQAHEAREQDAFRATIMDLQAAWIAQGLDERAFFSKPEPPSNVISIKDRRT
jgi:hypothetical protein